MDNLPEEFHELVNTQLANGVAAAIPKFFKNNRINFRPTDKCQEPIMAFAEALMSEWNLIGAQHDNLRPYPFKESLKAQLQLVVADSLQSLVELWDGNEFKNLEALCRVIGVGEAATFLEKHKGSAIKEMKEIRGE